MKWFMRYTIAWNLTFIAYSVWDMYRFLLHGTVIPENGFWFNVGFATLIGILSTLGDDD